MANIDVIPHVEIKIFIYIHQKGEEDVTISRHLGLSERTFYTAEVAFSHGKFNPNVG